MLKQLFSSRVRVDLLATFLMHPVQEFYLRELAVKLHSSPRSINVELRNLHEIGLLQKRISGKQHYYRINSQHPVFSDLRNLFLKTVGLKEIVLDQLQPHAAAMDFACIYGSMADGSFTGSSDLDLLIIGQVRSRQMSPIFTTLREKLGREIHATIFPLEEFAGKVHKQDHFISSLIKVPMLFIFGEENEFRGLVQKWLAEKASKQS